MSKAPAFMLYAADFYMDTASWDVATVGAYTRLLFYQWVNGSIPNDIEKIARIAGCMGDRKWRSNMERMWRELCHKFVPLPDGNLVNLRLEQSRAEKLAYSESQKKKGKKGADKRWGNDIAGAMAVPQQVLKPEHSSSSSSSSSLKEKNKEAASGPDLELQSALENVRKLYPNFHGIYAFIQTYKKHNRAALIHTLGQLIKYHENGTPVKDPFPFCKKIMENENGKFNARDHDAQAQQYKITKGEVQSFKEIFHARLKGD